MAIPLEGEPRGELATLTIHSNSVSAIQFSLDGRTMISASEDGHVAVWDWSQDWKEARIAKQLNGPVGVNKCEFSPNGKWLLAYGRPHTIPAKGLTVVWNTSDWSQQNEREISMGGTWIDSAFSVAPDSRSLLDGAQRN